MKIAIIHDWLETYAGAERTLEQMLCCFPDADVYSVVMFMNEENKQFLKGKQVKTTFIQRLPFARKHFRKYIGIMPMAIEQIDLSEYTLVISSSHAVAKGVITGPNQLHICYCYTPMRYAWELSKDYLDNNQGASLIKNVIISRMLNKLRQWDVISANRPDHIIGISQYICNRIQKHWRRKSTVIYPPVDVQSCLYNDQKRSNYYVTCSRLVPYKRIDLIVDTFTKLLPNKELVVIGDGPEYTKISNKAGQNVKMLGYKSAEHKQQLLANAKAFVFAAEEDFGIAPLEAQACGTPVIAFNQGGSKETIVELGEKNPTGVFFNQQNSSSLAEAVFLFEKHIDDFQPLECRNNACKFSNEVFREKLDKYVAEKLAEFVGQ